MANTYPKDSVVRVTVNFKSGGSLADPTTITLKVKDPAATLSTYTYALAEITKLSTGIYYKDILSSMVGDWKYQFSGAGALTATDESYYTIRASNF